MSLDRVKLARICELFRSDQDHERATAARMATAIVQSSGLTWTALLTAQPMSGSATTSSVHYQRAPSRSETVRIKSWNGHDAKELVERLLNEKRLEPFEKFGIKLLAQKNLDAGLTLMDWKWVLETWGNLSRRKGTFKPGSKKSRSAR